MTIATLATFAISQGRGHHSMLHAAASPKVPEPGALSGTDGIDGSSDLISSPLGKHRRELTNTIASRGNEGRGRGEDSEEAEELLEHLDGLLRIRRCGWRGWVFDERRTFPCLLR